MLKSFDLSSKRVDDFKYTQQTHLKDTVDKLKDEVADIRNQLSATQECTCKDAISSIQGDMEHFQSFIDEQKQHLRMKNKKSDEKIGLVANGSPAYKQNVRTRNKVEGSRKVWGTMKSTSASALSNAIKSLSDVDVNTLVIKRKYKITSTNHVSKWWFVIRGEESSLKNLDEKWEPISLHTSWKLEPLLSFNNAINDPTTPPLKTTDGAPKDEFETVDTLTKDPENLHAPGLDLVASGGSVYTPGKISM